MARFGKNRSFTKLLLVISALEFVGLTGALLTDSQARQESAQLRTLISSTDATPASAPASETDPAADNQIPDWLAPVKEKPKPLEELTGPELLAQTQLIAHGLGAVGEETVLNCLEGFEAQYQRGVRVFEADLRLTSDLQVVLRHDWRSGWQPGIDETHLPDLNEFLSKRIHGKYTPLSFRDLLLLMEKYPDICIITDTKFIEPEIVTLQFQAMLQDAADLGLSYVLDRLIVQIYDPLMFQVVDSLHHFDGYIYTLYAEGFPQTAEAFQEKAAYCAAHQIMGITLWDYWWDEEYAPIAEEYGLSIYTHTVNDPKAARALLESGISSVYTDVLAPNSLEGESEKNMESTMEKGETT